VEFIEMQEAGSCCGSAGIYNVTQPDMANQILEHKMTHAKATHAHYLVTGNPGCLLQMKLVLKNMRGIVQWKLCTLLTFCIIGLLKRRISKQIYVN
jgi:Fe-S oxidoreductase